MSKPRKTIAIIVAAGRGTRAGGEVAKQWQKIGAHRMIDATIAAFTAHPNVDDVLVVLHADELDALPGLRVTSGGATRAASVMAGLDALAGEPCDKVLIHDAARPCVSQRTISAVINALDAHDGAAPGLVVTDALWKTDGQSIMGNQDRDGLWRAQTPQGFRYDQIRAAHQAATGDEPDDVAVALAAGLDVVAVPGEETNIKVTHPDDFARAAQILGTGMDVRLGNGYDVHRFGPGDSVILCGVTIPHNRGLQGHSDADVPMHALTDAIYGALAEGDIGRHFPPSDPQWKGAASEIFLAHAAELARSKGYSISNADVTIICEYPKIGPHSDAMRAELSRILGVENDRISVKATTSEKLGFTGRSEGIASVATACLVRE